MMMTVDQTLAARIGLDWADAHHDVSLQEVGASNVERRRIAHEQEIDMLLHAHADAELFDSLPGAGAALVPRLLVAFGTDRERFHTASEVQQYSGIAPVTERSGTKTRVHWRWSASTFLRQSFHEFAGHSVQQSRWARACYELQVDAVRV